MKHLGVILLITGGILLTACGGIGLYTGNETDLAEQTEAQTESSTAEGADEEYDPFTQKPQFPDLHSFTAKTLSGGSFTAEDFADADVTAINIWSTTCGPCIREMPELAEYANSLPENLQIITWCLDAEYTKDSADISSFLEQSGFTGVTLISGDGDLQKLYGKLLYTPTTVFVDSAGNMVAEVIIGAGDIETKYSAQFAAALEQLGIEE